MTPDAVFADLFSFCESLAFTEVVHYVLYCSKVKQNPHEQVKDRQDIHAYIFKKSCNVSYRIACVHSHKYTHYFRVNSNTARTKKSEKMKAEMQKLLPPQSLHSKKREKCAF